MSSIFSHWHKRNRSQCLCIALNRSWCLARTDTHKTEKEKKRSEIDDTHSSHQELAKNPTSARWERIEREVREQQRIENNCVDGLSAATKLQHKNKNIRKTFAQIKYGFAAVIGVWNHLICVSNDVLFDRVLAFLFLFFGFHSPVWIIVWCFSHTSRRHHQSVNTHSQVAEKKEK